jgi:hypothetical protein
MSEYACFDIVRKWLATSPDLNQLDDSLHGSVLYRAAHHGNTRCRIPIAQHVRIIKLLLDHGADPDLGICNVAERPVYFQVSSPLRAALEFHESNLGYAPEEAQYAAAQMRAMVLLLLKAGADVNFRTQTKYSNMSWASSETLLEQER